MRKSQINFFTFLVAFGTLVCSNQSSGFAIQEDAEQVAGPSEKRTVEPVFRVSKLTDPETKPAEAAVEPAPVKTTPNPKPPVEPKATPHPLDQALSLAYDGLENMKANISDYTAILSRRERVNDKLTERSFVHLKVRNDRDTPQGHQPFSVYMKFLKPRAAAGREVIWVQGRNGNKIIAHESGMLRFKRFELDPDGWLAMKNNRYPIYDAGLENLVVKLIEKAERDRAAGMCEVEYRENASINKRPCTMIRVIHNERQHPYEFYKAEVFIDDELKIPVRYASYDWPQAGQAPKLLEEYTYVNVKLNVGLTDKDFNPDNPEYKFPK